MKKIFTTATGVELFLHNGKFYSNYPFEVMGWIQRDINSSEKSDAESASVLKDAIELSGGIRKIANKVILSFSFENRTRNSDCVMEGIYPVDELRKDLKEIPYQQLMNIAPEKGSKLTEITLEAINTTTNKLMYKRTITIR